MGRVLGRPAQPEVTCRPPAACCQRGQGAPDVPHGHPNVPRTAVGVGTCGRPRWLLSVTWRHNSCPRSIPGGVSVESQCAPHVVPHLMGCPAAHDPGRWPGRGHTPCQGPVGSHPPPGAAQLGVSPFPPPATSLACLRAGSCASCQGAGLATHLGEARGPPWRWGQGRWRWGGAGPGPLRLSEVGEDSKVGTPQPGGVSAVPVGS